MIGVAFTRSRFISLSLTCIPIVAPQFPRWLRIDPRPFVMVATHWHPSTPTHVANMLKAAGLQLASLLCMGSTSRHVTSRLRTHFSIDCIFSSHYCHPSHSPTVPTPVSSLCGSCNPVTRTPYYIIRLMYTVFSTFVTTQSTIRQWPVSFLQSSPSHIISIHPPCSFQTEPVQGITATMVF